MNILMVVIFCATHRKRHSYKSRLLFVPATQYPHTNGEQFSDIVSVFFFFWSTIIAVIMSERLHNVWQSISWDP